MPEFIITHSAEEYKAAAILFYEYAAWLTIDMGFQNFDNELIHLKEMYAAPDGGIVLCKKDHEFIA